MPALLEIPRHIAEMIVTLDAIISPPLIILLPLMPTLPTRERYEGRRAAYATLRQRHFHAARLPLLLMRRYFAMPPLRAIFTMPYASLALLIDEHSFSALRYADTPASMLRCLLLYASAAMACANSRSDALR